MKYGDMVIYSQRHYEWLESAGKWPRNTPRRQVVGVVEEAAAVVRVNWDFGIVKNHYPDNLELL